MPPQPTTPPDGDPDWGQRRQGTSPPPRSFAESEERLRSEWDSVNEAWAREREREHAAGQGRGTAGAGDPGGFPGAGAGAAGGWQAHRPGGLPDLSALFVLLDTLRAAAPAELQERTTALIKEILLTLRSLIDWYLERLDRPRGGPEVEDIRID